MLPLKDFTSSPCQHFPIQCKLDLTSPQYKKADGKPWSPEIKPNDWVLLYGSITHINQKPDGSAYPKQVNYIKVSVSEVVYSAGGNQIIPKIEPGKETQIYFNYISYLLASPLGGKGKQPASTSPLKISFCTAKPPFPSEASTSILSTSSLSSLSSSGLSQSLTNWRINYIWIISRPPTTPLNPKLLRLIDHFTPRSRFPKNNKALVETILKWNKALCHSIDVPLLM